MKDGLRQSMAWLHTWSGLLVCWVLLLVFCGGTASYFKQEISLWMKPELHGAAARPVPAIDAAEAALRTLQEKAPRATRWFISLPDERTPATRVTWVNPPPPGAKQEGGRRNFKTELLDPATGAILSAPRETRGGEFLYRLHFDLHYMSALWARWIVGFCAMFMLVSIVSGVITHKRIFKDFFTFRPKKGQRSWLDAHNATAVLALPFHLMITYTGLVTLMFLYMPAAATAAYQGDQKLFSAEVFPNGGQNGKAADRAVPLTAIRPLLEQAERHWGHRAGALSVNFPNDANARIAITREGDRQLSHKEPSMQFDGASGALLATIGDELSASSQTHGVMVGLHLAHFAGPLLRALFFLSGLAGCAMVATGALLWAVKTRQKQAKALAAGAGPSFGLRLVDALNIGAIAGLPIAFASFFWANRLLPVVMEQRQEREIACFFAAWGLAAVLAQVRPTRAMWRLQLGAGAFLFAALPLLNVFTTDSHLGVTLFQGKGPSPVAGFDLTVLALGLALGYATYRLGGAGARKQQAKPAPAAAHTMQEAA